LLPISILLLGALASIVLIATKPKPSTEEGRIPAPMLRIVPAVRSDVQLTVSTHGTVVPRTQSELVPEVSGAIVWVSPALVSGGFFEEDEELLRVDPRDYQVALEQARANLARRQSEYERTKKQLSRNRELSTRDVASQTQLDDAENAERVAAAELRVAQAVLGQAERNLERTTLRAPYSGRVRDEQVGVGQFVDRGKPIATLYAVDFAEVRLPLPDDQLAFLDLALSHGTIEQERQPIVVLRAQFAGQRVEWQGRIVRTEGEIDAKSRMVHVIARVPDPYGRKQTSVNQAEHRPPLAPGLFVEAEVYGRKLHDVFVLPRSALRDGSDVVIVDASNQLRRRSVEVIRTERDNVIIASGLNEGDRAVISDLDIIVEGMTVDTTVEPSQTLRGEVENAS